MHHNYTPSGRPAALLALVCDFVLNRVENYLCFGWPRACAQIDLFMYVDQDTSALSPQVRLTLHIHTLSRTQALA